MSDDVAAGLAEGLAFAALSEDLLPVSSAEARVGGRPATRPTARQEMEKRMSCRRIVVLSCWRVSEETWKDIDENINTIFQHLVVPRAVDVGTSRDRYNFTCFGVAARVFPTRLRGPLEEVPRNLRPSTIPRADPRGERTQAIVRSGRERTGCEPREIRRAH